MQQDLEQRLISLIKDSKSFSDILVLGVDSEAFIVHTEVFNYIKKYYNKYNYIPAKAIIQSTFPGFSFVDDVQDHETKYLCDELVKSKVKREAIFIINNTIDLLSIDTYGAIDSAIHKLSNIKKESPSYLITFTDADALIRYNKVAENKEKASKGLSVGLKTGISFLDEKYLGWQLGNLIGIVGRLGVGKSWIAEYLACQVYAVGKKVLFLSPELSVDEVNLRWDTIMGKINGYTFLNDELQVGRINLTEYREWLEKVSSRKDWLTLDTSSGKSFTIERISSLVNEFSPDLLVVDGIALIENGGEKSWEKVMSVSYGLKSIAQNNKIVVIATSQVNREAKDEMPRPDQISYGDAFAQAVDDLIVLQQDINEPNIRYATIPKRRTGKAINERLVIQFDVNRGVLSM